MKKILFITILLAFVCSCQDNYADLKNQVDKLQSNYENLNSSLEKAIAKSMTVAVTDVEGGHKLTFSDGTSFVVKDGEPGEPGDPGEPGAPGEPGSDATVEIEETADSYVFKVGDKTYTIPKTTGFSLILDRDEAAVFGGQKVSVNYTLTGADESTKVFVDGSNGIKGSVNPEAGTIAITVPMNVSNGDFAIVTAVSNQTGQSASKYIIFKVSDTFTGEEMVLVPGGTFTVGEGAVHTDAGSNTWQCTLPDYYIARTEVTQKLWAEIMGEAYLADQLSDGQKPDGYICYPVGKGDDIAQPYINWFDAIIFSNKLSLARGYEPVYTVDGETDPDKWNKSGNWETKVVCDWNKDGFRLPALPEWEFAAGGGQVPLQKFPGTDNFEELGQYGNIEGALPGGATEGLFPVAKKKPNKLGIYDMAGNATEWVWELWFEYPGGSRTYYNDVITWNYGARQAIKRGGTIWNWGGQVYYTTSNWRDPMNDHNWPCGMRLARTCKD